ncbi:clumping factor B-like isoform X3 [Bolinopsis microptera]|uniref:clumping factor B-like isoform X3 n=1 Tax=Bolinopsis microptera TaxID=2820187 RepID=UPI00307ADCE0
MRIVLLLHVLLLLLEVRGDGGEVPTTPSEFGVITNPLSSEASFDDIPSEGPYVIQALPDPAPDPLPDSGPEETVAGESETGGESADVETGGESTDVETGYSTDVETGGESTDVETGGESTDVKPDGETADDESAEGDLEDSFTEDETLPDIPEGDVSEPEVDDAPAEEDEIEEEEKKEEIPDQDKEAPASSKLGKEDEDGFIEEDVEVEKIDDANRPRPMVNTEDKTTGPFEEGTESDNVAKVPIVVEEEAVNVAELVLTNTGGLIICHVEADPLIYTSCNMSVWVNGLENSTTINVYQTSTLILETDSVKCKASCSSATGPVTMTAKHAPSNIFTLPIMILIGIGGLVVITTILILIHFIKKSRRKEKGYHFPLNDNTVEAYNLEEEVKPAASLNGTQVVVSDSYNLVDG